MDAFAAWLFLCDLVAGFVAEGRMTDDFPDYDWHDAWAWGETPMRAVRAALETSCD
jgi:hypothetical protein